MCRGRRRRRSDEWATKRKTKTLVGSRVKRRKMRVGRNNRTETRTRMRRGEQSKNDNEDNFKQQ